MSRRESRKDKLIATEERRFIVLLGILTLIVAYKDSLPRDFPYPFPYHVPHLQIFVLPLFTSFVVIFGLYSVFMLGYFSEDKLPRWIREILRRAAWAVLVGYWAWFFYVSSGF